MDRTSAIAHLQYNSDSKYLKFDKTPPVQVQAAMNWVQTWILYYHFLWASFRLETPKYHVSEDILINETGKEMVSDYQRFYNFPEPQVIGITIMGFFK